MKRRGCLALVFLLVVSALLVVGGCGLGGSGGESLSNTSTSVSDAAASTDFPASPTSTLTAADQLSTFKAKDPFIQQAQPTTTTTAATTTTLAESSTTTTVSGGTAANTQPLSDTASVHIHSLKILSIQAGPTVTFKVDSAIYEAKKVGDVVTTTWGQVKVLSIDTAAQYVKLLHGSETLKLEVGQTTFE